MSSFEKAGDANALSGDFGETWLQVVASGCGMLHGRPTTLDFEKADVELVLREEVENTTYPSVKAQVKTTLDLRVDDEGFLVYDLDVHAYNILRRDNVSFRRILVVIRLSDDGERVRLGEDGTLLVGRGAWVSLEGEPETANTSTIAVRLPVSNTLDPDGLRRMLMTYGVLRSTPVPDVDPWTEGESDDST